MFDHYDSAFAVWSILTSPELPRIVNKLRRARRDKSDEHCLMVQGKDSLEVCQALAVDRTQSRSTDVHKDVHAASHLGRSTERSTDCKCPTLGWGRSTGQSTVSLGPVDRAVDRPESNCFLNLARSTGRSTAGLNGHFFNHWPVDRPVDWKGKNALFSCQRADLK